MATVKEPLLSVVVPLFNEAAGLEAFHTSLTKELENLTQDNYEIVYCDDGSTDATPELVRGWRRHNRRLKLVRLSRNFGKESALAAGLAAARGRAILTLDGDGQHPVELIPEFVAAWQAGAQVVVGVRTNPSGSGWTKSLAPRIFYRLLNMLVEQEVVSGASDFRLIDQAVQRVFLELKENNRMTRGLIDWLGFKRVPIYYEAKARTTDKPGYSLSKLVGLAMSSLVSLSPKPLYLFGYVGVFITLAALLLGLSVIIEQLILGDPLRWHFTGTAMLGILTLFLVGILLVAQGILSLYVSHIHAQSKGRPLYVIDYRNSAGIREEDETA